MKSDSPQSLPSLDHPSPTSEDLSHLPKCRKCGLTTKQHEFVRLYICGHLCRDIAQDNFCPDIDALQLTSKDCPIHSPKNMRITRRRSSLSKPPMLARDESTYGDVSGEQRSKEVSTSPDQKHPVEENELPIGTTPIKNDEGTTYKMPVYTVSENANGDTDWRKHCRVEKAMKQMLFGDAKVSPHTVLEHTQRLRTSDWSLAQAREDANTPPDTPGEDDGGHDALHAAMAAANLETETQSAQTAQLGEDTELKKFKLAQAEAAQQDNDCAICSDDEAEDPGDDLQDGMPAATATSKIRGCVSDDECSSCAEDHLHSGDTVPEEAPQMWMDRSRAC
jgi:hypothetical protein